MPSISYSSSCRLRCHSAWYSITSSIDCRRRRFLLTRKPMPSRVFSTSHCAFVAPAGSSVYMNVCRSRPAVTLGSIWRTLPAAVLRGFTKRGRPAASISRLSFSNPAIGKSLRRRHTKRHAANRPHVRGDVLAGGSVTARRGSLEPSLRVGEADRQAVDLELAAVHDLVAHRGAHALVEGPDLVFVERVLE